MSEDKKYTESDVREFAAYYSLLSKDETDFTLFRHFEKWEASKQPVQKERIEVTDIWAVKEHDTNNPIGFRVCCTKLVTKDKIPEIKNLLERYLNGEMDNPAPHNDTNISKEVLPFFYEVNRIEWKIIETQFHHYTDYFNTRIEAEQFVLENKPCLSLNDIRLISMIHGQHEKIQSLEIPLYDLKETIKQKLSQ